MVCVCNENKINRKLLSEQCAATNKSRQTERKELRMNVNRSRQQQIYSNCSKHLSEMIWPSNGAKSKIKILIHKIYVSHILASFFFTHLCCVLVFCVQIFHFVLEESLPAIFWYDICGVCLMIRVLNMYVYWNCTVVLIKCKRYG